MSGALELSPRTEDFTTWRPRVNPWLIALSVVLATFMEVLDTTIVMVALPHIAGSMAATQSEATWTLTSYLVANGIVVPTTAWLALRFGRKRLIMACTVLFVASSMACGLAPNLAVLVVARIFQGLGGGAMVPATQAVLLESFPPAQRGMAMALFGVVVVLAPIIGPTFGGWLTDNYSWRWTFFINLPVGLTSLVLMAYFLEDPPWIQKAKAGKLDSWGLALLAIWVGALQIVLDKGQDEDWFASPFITRLSVIMAVALAAFVVRELRTREPVVDLRVFGNRNFWTATVTVALVSWVMYSSSTLLPQFLQTLMGYNAEWSGWAISPRGFGVMLAMPLAGYLSSLIDGRKIVVVGLTLLAWSNHLLSNLTLEVGISNLALANFVQGVAMGLVFVPLTTLAVATLRNEQMGNATGLFNLVRNIGGSVGISVMVTYLVRRAQAHQALLVSHLTPYDVPYQQRLQFFQWALSRISQLPHAIEQAHAAVYMILLQQAALKAYVDVYRFLALAVFVCVPTVLLMRRTVTRGLPGFH